MSGRSKPFGKCALAEALERRTLLAAPDSQVLDTAQLEQEIARNIIVHVPIEATPLAGSATPVGLTPAQLRGAYGLGQYGTASAIKFGTIEGDGSGQTVAIVDAYHYPTALADLTTFDTQFGLPAPPSFTVINQSG